MENIIAQFNWRIRGKQWTSKNNRLGQLPQNLKPQELVLIYPMGNAVYLYIYYISSIKKTRKINLMQFPGGCKP